MSLHAISSLYAYPNDHNYNHRALSSEPFDYTQGRLHEESLRMTLPCVQGDNAGVLVS